MSLCILPTKHIHTVSPLKCRQRFKGKERGVGWEELAELLAEEEEEEEECIRQRSELRCVPGSVPGTCRNRSRGGG